MDCQLLHGLPWSVRFICTLHYNQTNNPSRYPVDIPSGTAVPHWAYQNVSVCLVSYCHSFGVQRVIVDRFIQCHPCSTCRRCVHCDTPNITSLSLDAPESTATKLQSTATAVISTTLPASITTMAGVATGAPSPTQTSSVFSSKSNTGAIVGGVVGGAVALGAIAAFVTWFCIRHRRQTKPPSAMYDATAPANSMYSATSPFAPSITQTKIYVSLRPMI